MVQPQFDRPTAPQAADVPQTEAVPQAEAAGQTVVASYASYAEAERAVDHLSDREFPVERAAIVGRGLTSFEKVTGRLTSWGAAGQGALSGAVIGALFGWLFGLLNWVDPVISGLL
ncbi:MAG TPA: general stress protein, partial [Pilimelia sp.]|nr:general stress protein [Pilimelia sp.]